MQPEFTPGCGSFDVFVERFELYSTVNEIAEAQKLHLFLSAIGEDAYVTLQKSATTQDGEHVVVPGSRVGAEQALFCEALKKLASLCDFGAFLEQALRDRLIAGLHSEAVRCRLLAMSDSELTCDRVCNTASAMEMAAKDAVEMVAENTT
ncbi:hypothetical protein MTO96_038378 [Rhipicephalus appendiculatus]